VIYFFKLKSAAQGNELTTNRFGLAKSGILIKGKTFEQIHSQGLRYDDIILSRFPSMAKPKKIQDAVRISVVMSKAQRDRVEYMTRSMIKQTGKLITISQAIRMAIEAVYPIPKNQLDLFGN
jgi:hypothetical protein